ncbi:hypothetical protein TNCV_2401661 [Trichonephila clavipes]|nr:hypothetical protein TNCV_2401661 [Trichonephila clavipes]
MLTSTIGEFTYAENALHDGRANGNGTAALRMTHDQFPDRRMPDQRLNRQICETRSFHVPRHDAGRMKTCMQSKPGGKPLERCD